MIFYSISDQRWYRIELEVLTIVFSDKDLHVVLLEGTKKMNWVLVTQKERKKEGYHMRKCILCKDCLKEKYLWILIQEKKIE